MRIETPAGKVVELSFHEYTTGRILLYVDRVEGRSVRGYGTGPHPLERAQNGCTHYLCIGEQGIGLDEGTAQQITEAQQKAQAEIDNRSDVVRKRLREERDNLVRAVTGTYQDQRAAAARSHESGEGTGAWVRVQESYDEEIAAANQALADFDAAHPDVIEEIKQGAEESRKRHEWD
jgi:hypothetical protein